MGSYYNDPSGYGTWWVEDGQTPQTALQNWEDQTGAQFGGPDGQGQLATPYTPKPGMSAPTAGAGDQIGGQQVNSANGSNFSQTNGYLMVKMPDGQVKAFTDINEELNQAFQNGAQLQRADGSFTTPKQFNGGWIAQGVDGQYGSMQTWMSGGQYAPGESEALVSAGLNKQPQNVTPGDGTIRDSSGNIVMNTGGAENKNGAGNLNSEGGNVTDWGGMVKGLDDNTGKMIKQMITMNLSRLPGLNQYGNKIDSMTNHIYDMMNSSSEYRDSMMQALAGGPTQWEGFMNDMVKNTLQQRDTQVSRALEPVMGSLQGFYDRANTSDAMSPTAQAAMRNSASQDITNQYNGAASNLKTELLRRGAIGGGDLPGSVGDIVRGFGPLESGRATALAQSNRDIDLTAEQQRLSSLMQNRQLASSAVGMGSNLMSSLGQIYDPSSFLNASNQATGQRMNQAQIYGSAYDPTAYMAGLNGMNNSELGAFNAGTGLFNSAGGMGGTLGELEPNSFRNILLASLISSGGKAIPWDKIFSGAGKILGGITNTGSGGGGTSTGTGPGEWPPIDTYGGTGGFSNPFPQNTDGASGAY